MNKSLVILGFLMILVYGSFVVSALMTRTDTDSLATKVDYLTEISISKGWNLVLASPLYGTKDLAITSDSEIKKENIKAVFYYFRYENKYLQMYPESEQVDNYLRNAQGKPEEALYFAQAPVWIYSDKEGFLRYNREDFPKDVFPKLTAGWNFLTITPEWAGKTTNELRGNCVYEKVYWYGKDGGVTGWGDLLNNPNFIDKEKWELNNAGAGLLIKVPSDCQFGTSSEKINPPAMP